nr:hypothetical protein Iba_chr06bCG13830 [Ipomoea batatas]GME18138.1 hypothetical protein Iba_scaffold19988CG0020 [Ipomoea batatas]
MSPTNYQSCCLHINASKLIVSTSNRFLRPDPCIAQRQSGC